MAVAHSLEREVNIVSVQLAIGTDAAVVHYINQYAENGADAIVIDTSGHFPKTIFEPIRQAMGKNIPVFALYGDFWEADNIKRVIDSGAVALPVKSSASFAFYRGLEKIVKEQRDLQKIVSTATTMFDRPDFYDKREFIDFMLNPELMQVADFVSKGDGTIIVDCGHIDSPTHLPTKADQLALEQGILLVKYLRLQGHDAKLGILFNDMHPFNYVTKKYTRRANDLLRRQIKNSGSHFGINQAYFQYLEGHGITADKYKDFIVPSLESNLKFAAKQSLDAQAESQQFDTSVTQAGKGYSYSRSTSAPTIQISSYNTGAPLCNMVSAEQIKKYEVMGARMAIFLRDEKWGCGVRGGGNAARNLYGTMMPAHAVFYTTNRNGLVPLKSVRL